MASVFETYEFGEHDDILGAHSPAEPVVAESPLFRFRLRQLLAFVTAICALLTALVCASGVIALALTIMAAVVAMHVFATTLGNTLQTRMKLEKHSRLPTTPIDPMIPCVSDQSDTFAAVRSQPLSPWHGRSSTYVPWRSRVVTGGMLISGFAGCLALIVVLGDKISMAGSIIGAISFAVLGGWFAFLCCNFYGVFRQGFREALADQQKDRSLRTARK